MHTVGRARSGAHGRTHAVGRTRSGARRNHASDAHRSEHGAHEPSGPRAAASGSASEVEPRGRCQVSTPLSHRTTQWRIGMVDVPVGGEGQR